MFDIHVVSHTHWDREWYLTYEQFRLRLVALIDRLLDLLDADPAYKYFHLDGQTIVLEDYLEIRPEQEARLRRAIASGRILIGPWYVMPDEFLVSGESIVRNLGRGHHIAREFGTPMPVGYLPDLFGHVAQMPQIWRQFGIDNTILWRGFGGTSAEYWWEAPDGSRVLMIHLPPEGYCNATRLVFDPDAAMTRAARAVDVERERSKVGQVLLMNGVDHVEPQVQIPDLIAQLSAIPNQRAHHSTLPYYVTAVRGAVESASAPLDTVSGELRSGEDYANLLPGVLSARVYLKQHNAHVQTLLESYAEPLSAFAWLATHNTARPEPVEGRDRDARGSTSSPRAHQPFRYPAGELRHAWKTLMHNHPHDSICGCSIDAVHEENVIRFARARQVAEGVAERASDAIADTVAAATGAWRRVLAVNPDAVERAQLVEAFIDLPIESAEPWRTVDPQVLDRPVTFWPRDSRITAVANAMERTATPKLEIVTERRPEASAGRSVPFQILGEQDVVVHEMSRFETPWALHARRVHLLWWAPALPPCGYAAFDLQVADEQGDARRAPVQGRRTGAATVVPYDDVSSTDRSAENAFLRMSIHEDGAIEIVDKATGIVYRGVGRLEDSGDVGDEYNYCPPATDRRITPADGRVSTVTRIHGGLLRATFRIELELPLPAAATPDRQRRDRHTVGVPVEIEATLDAGSPRVTFSVSIDNTVRDHRLRILFPTGAARVDTVRADTAFDIVTRPARREVPVTIRNEAPVSSAPMISVVDAGDGRAGATVIGKGLMEYEIVEDEQGGQASVALTLLRAVGDLSRNDLATRPSGHAGPPVSTPGAQCPGRHRFEVAFEPRGNAPAPGQMFASARAVTVAPRVVAARKPGGTGALVHSFVTVDRRAGHVVLSALKKSEDRESVVLRLFNPEDREAEVRIGTTVGTRRAYTVNFLEERQEELSVDEGAVTVRLKPHRIQTIELCC